MGLRKYDFDNVGVETDEQPTPTDPSADADVVTKGWADDHYTQGGASVADLTALAAIAAADRADGDLIIVQSVNLPYVFDAGSAATADGARIVAPAAGTGRWYVAGPYGLTHTSGNYAVDGDLTVTGNLTVQGTTTTLNTATMDVEDPNITVNKGGNQATANSSKSGIKVEMSDATHVFFGYDSTLASRFKCGDSGSESEVITAAGTQTMTGVKTLTSPVLNTGVSGTAVLDEDDMASNSATKLATQQSIKAYVDTQVAGAASAETVTTTAITSSTTIGTSSSSVRVCSSASAFDLTFDNTFAAGRNMTIKNDGTNEVTLKANDATTICTLYRKTRVRLIALSASPATNTDWMVVTSIVSPWIAYTPTFNGLGTVTNITCAYKRVGDSIFITGRATAGTVAASEFRIGLPGSIVTNTQDTGHTIPVGFLYRETSGSTSYSIATLLAEDNFNYVNVGVSAVNTTFTTNVQTKINGNSMLNNSESIAWYSSAIQIADWTEHTG